MCPGPQPASAEGGARAGHGPGCSPASPHHRAVSCWDPKRPRLVHKDLVPSTGLQGAGELLVGLKEAAECPGRGPGTPGCPPSFLPVLATVRPVAGTHQAQLPSAHRARHHHGRPGRTPSPWRTGPRAQEPIHCLPAWLPRPGPGTVTGTWPGPSSSPRPPVLGDPQVPFLPRGPRGGAVQQSVSSRLHPPHRPRRLMKTQPAPAPLWQRANAEQMARHGPGLADY